MKRTSVRCFLFACCLLSTLMACKSTRSNDISESLTAPGMKGFSTEHRITGVGNTACGLTRHNVEEIHTRGYYYVAVPRQFLDEGKRCGTIVEVTVGGACYDSNINCMGPTGSASLESFAAASGQAVPNATIKLFIADECGSCVSNATNPHFDIIDRAYQTGAPLQELRTYLEANIQSVRQSGTNRTAQPNNLFLKSITFKDDCAPGLSFAAWVPVGKCKH